MKQKVSIVENLLKLVHNTSTWRLIVISMAVIGYDLHIKHKVIVFIAILTETTYIFIVVVIR